LTPKKAKKSWEKNMNRKLVSMMTGHGDAAWRFEASPGAMGVLGLTPSGEQQVGAEIVSLHFFRDAAREDATAICCT
jgi:hypothetical protein